MDLMQVSLEKYGNGNVHDFPVNYNSYDKSDIFKIYKYLMNTNNMKQCLALLNKRLLYY